jgi:hypothetical protein
MSKMGSHEPFGYLKHKLWPKEGGQFDSRPLEVGNCPNLLMCSWRAIYLWKDLDEGYNFASKFTSFEGLHKMLWASKVRSPNFGNFGIPNLGVPRQNDIWVQAPWPSTKNTIRGKNVASPKSRSWWILWFRVCLCLICPPKMFQLCTTQLVVLFMQVCVNNWPTYHSS